MRNSPAKQLKELKAFNLAKCEVTFWLVKRRPAQREATYTVLRVDIDEPLKKRFRGYVKSQLQTRDFHVEEYAFTNADTDDVLLTIGADTTDFKLVQTAIDSGFKNQRAQEYSQLLNSWAYVVQFECESGCFYAWRKINALTQPKRAISTKVLLFKNHKLEDIDDSEVFLIDPRFDFFVYKDVTFIANKREFESSMNFRQGMKDHGEELLTSFESLAFLSDVAPIRDYVGDNLFHLRKLASIRKAGYHLKPEYLARLIEVNGKEGWGLKVENGKIVVEPETIELLLKLLNNDRLRSPINEELFDSAAKKAVQKQSAAK